jgi:hypothetical protein
MKTKLLIAAAVAALSIGASSAQALPASLELNETATQGVASSVEQAGVRFHFGFYGYPYYYNYYGYGYSCYRWSHYWGRYIYVC